jgi:hypothetical protein
MACSVAQERDGRVAVRVTVVGGSKGGCVLIGLVVQIFVLSDRECSFNLELDVKIKVTTALTREIAEDPRKRAGDSFDNYKVIYISRQEPM